MEKDIFNYESFLDAFSQTDFIEEFTRLGMANLIAPPSLDVYVQYSRGCLPSEEAIKNHFSMFGTVMSVIRSEDKSFAFVHFSTGRAVDQGGGGIITKINYRTTPPHPTINLESNSTMMIGFYQADTFYCKTEMAAISGKIVNRKKEGDIQIFLNTFNYAFKPWQIEKVVPSEDKKRLLIVWSYRTGPLIYAESEQRTLNNPFMLTDNDCNAIIVRVDVTSLNGKSLADVFKKMLHEPDAWKVEYLHNKTPPARVPSHSLEIELLLESLTLLRIPKMLLTEEFYAIINNTELSKLKWALRLMLTNGDPRDVLHSDPSEDNTIENIVNNRKQPAEFILDPVKALKEALEQVDQRKLKQRLYNQYRLIDGPSSEYMRTYMLEVTPTKMFLTGPSIDQSNRVLRKYKDSGYHFIRVTFRDSDGNRFMAIKEEFQDFIKHKMKYGIQLGGKTFTYLAYANSELRMHSCYFVAPFEFNGELMTAEKIIEQLGTFKDKTVAKRASRIGQCFSSTVGGFVVTFEVEMIDDIHPLDDLGQPNPKYNFTDGTGKISPDLAKALGYDACAFQIRFGGCKGMLVVDTSLTGLALQLRPSMKKFDANPLDNELEINGVAQYLPAYLNRQMITLLLARGTPVEALTVLRDQMTDELVALFADDVPEETLNTLLAKYTTGFGETVLKKVAHAFRDDLFIQNLLSLQCYKSVQQTREKTRIRVQQGAHLYGVIDEHGYLEENQIFVRLQDNTLNPSLQQITGPAFVTRSPSLHPGDIRMVQCIDVPELHHLKNVIVFPRKGKRPLTDMISGGDLDGDLYTVIWDATLFPQNDFPPMDFNKASVQEETVVYPDSFIAFFVKYMATDRLGIIANAWLSWAEMDPKGAACEKCIKLAQLFSLAVDYPKTGGDEITMPTDLEPDQCPDYLGNRFKPSFPAKSFIGDTYRYCQEKLKFFEQSKIKKLTVDKIWLIIRVRIQCRTDGQNLIHRCIGSQKWLDEAEDSFEEYRFRVLQLMRMYRVTEVEAFSGVILASDKYMKHRQNAAELNVRFLEIRRDILNQFKHGLSDEESDDMFAKASAWYTIAYQIKGRFPSFAWLLYDQLLQLKEAKHQG